MSGHGRPHVNLEAFASVIRGQIAQRGGSAQTYLSNNTSGPHAIQASLADEIAASGLMSLSAAKRRIYAILNPNYMSRGKGVVQQAVDFDTADKILCALNLEHLWYTELADDVTFPRCSLCGGAAGIKNPGCKRCSDRFSLRRHRAKRGPAPSPVAVESGSTASCGATPIKPSARHSNDEATARTDERTVAA